MQRFRGQVCLPARPRHAGSQPARKRSASVLSGAFQVGKLELSPLRFRSCGRVVPESTACRKPFFVGLNRLRERE